MRIKLIEDLPMGGSAEPYQLSWVIERLLADPRHILQVRSQLHTGQQVQYLSRHDGKLRSARVVGMHGDHLGIQDDGYAKPFKVHYADISRSGATYRLATAQHQRPSTIPSQARRRRRAAGPTSESAAA